MSIEVTPPQQGYESLRRWPRYKVDMPIRLLAERPTRVSVVQGRGRELNSGGMAVVAASELDVDEQVAVEFTPPYSAESITVRAFVRNRCGSMYGIEFITENDADYGNVAQLELVLKALESAAHQARRAQACA